MKSKRLRHALAQFDASRTRAFWQRFDHSVRLPWFVATIAWPVVFGVRMIVWVGVVPRAALKNLRAWHPPEGGELAALADSPFVLVLRTFGNDGGMLLTAETIEDFDVVPRAQTLEEVVGEIAAANGLSAIGFADHDLRSVPDGVRYVKADHDGWRQQFEDLVEAAAAIIVMPTPGRRLGDNFRCEMEHILQSGKRQKTIVVGPPDLDETTRQATYETYRLLGWPSVKHVHLSAHDGTDGRLVVHPSVGADDPVLGGRYQRAIETAIQEVIARP